MLTNALKQKKQMNLSKLINNKTGRLAIPALMSILALSGCVDDKLLVEGYELSEDEFLLEIPLRISGTEQRTRAHFAEKNTTEVIENIWVGVYNMSTGQRVGSEFFDINSVYASGHDENNARVRMKCIGFNDVGRSRYIIAGVANYDGVRGMSSANINEEATIEELLKEADTLEKYISLTADVSSIQEAQTDGNLFLSGIWSASDQNASIDHNGNLSGKYENSGNYVMYVEFNPYSDNSERDNYYKKFTVDGGHIHLRPLNTHAHVNVTFGDGLTVSDFQWKLGNIPAYTFVQERTTQTEMGAQSGDEYKRITPAASDLYENAYYTTGWISGTSLPSEFVSTNANGENRNNLYELNNVCNVERNNITHGTDAITQSGNQYSFGFWHYDNKHWGLASCNDYAMRERKDVSGNYVSLCSNNNQGLNNNASYFVIKAHIRDRQGNEGDAEFLIHEGYACQTNGLTEEDPTAAARDFTVFRNTDYTYNVTINGLNDIIVKVFADSGDVDPNANPGATGNIFGNIVESEVPAGESFKINLKGNQPLEWGITDDEIYFGQYAGNTKIQNELTGTPLENYDNNDFYRGVTIKKTSATGAGSPLKNFVPDSDGEYEIRMPESENDEFSDYKIYVAGSYVSSDGKTSYHPVFLIIQGAAELLAPVISMPDCLSNNGDLVLGVDDHTIYWEPVKPTKKGNVVKYITYLTAKSGSGFDQKVEIDETGRGNNNNNYFKDGKFFYKALYSTMTSNYSYGQNITFGVIAVEFNSSGVEVNRTEMVTIQKRLVEPTWNFSSAEWSESINYVTSQAQTLKSYNITINGLNLLAGLEDDTSGDCLRAGNSNGTPYFQFQGIGNTNRLRFKFQAATKGTLTVVVANTGNSNGSRYATVQIGEDGSNTINGTGAPDQNTVSSTFLINPSTTPQNVYVYQTFGGLRIYSLKFEPTD